MPIGVVTCWGHSTNSRVPCQTPIPVLSIRCYTSALSMQLYNDLYRFTMSCPLGDLLPCCVPRSEHWFDTSASIQNVCLLFRVPPGQLLIVYSTAQPCWASLCREQSIAVLHVVWFLHVPIVLDWGRRCCKPDPPPPPPPPLKKKTNKRTVASDGVMKVLSMKDRTTGSQSLEPCLKEKQIEGACKYQRGCLEA